MDSENQQSYDQVKTFRFVLDNKHKCQIKRNHSSTHVSLATSAILFLKLCWLFQISSGRDGRASKSGRRPMERTGIVLLIPAALLLAQTNRLLMRMVSSMISQMFCKWVMLGQKLGHKVKSFICFRGYIFSPILMKLCQNVYLNII